VVSLIKSLGGGWQRRNSGEKNGGALQAMAGKTNPDKGVQR
jgi:hypothetical protein